MLQSEGEKIRINDASLEPSDPSDESFLFHYQHALMLVFTACLHKHVQILCQETISCCQNWIFAARMAQ